MLVWGLEIGQQLVVDPSYNLKPRTKTGPDSIRILLDGTDLIKLSFQESNSQSSELTNIPVEEYEVFSSEQGLEVYWTPSESVPRYDLTISITDTSMVTLIGEGGVGIDLDKPTASRKNNPGIYVPSGGLDSFTSKSIGTAGAVITGTGTVTVIVIGSFGFSLMYLARLIQFMEFISYFILFNTDLGPRLNYFLYELYVVM